MSGNTPEFFIETIHPYFKGPEPVFFEKTNYPWAIELENSAESIIENLATVLNDEVVIKTGLGRIKAEEKYFFPPKLKMWKGYYFYYNGFKINSHLRLFPVVEQQLKKIPNLISANIAVLEPGTKILPHRGTTNGFIRAHLGLKIPGTMPACGFVINGIEVNWEKGKLWLFGDMNTHWAINNTNEKRYILMLDVVRPEFTRYKKLLCVHQLAKYMASATCDYMRSFFHIDPPVLSHDPYNAEKIEQKIKMRKNQEAPGQKFIRLLEDQLFRVYKYLLWIVFSFRKLQ